MAIRFPALYNAARIAAASRVTELPTVRFTRETVVYRNVGVMAGPQPSSPESASTVFNSVASPANRWTGATTDPGRPGVGGLYVTLDIDALTGELLFYSCDASLERETRMPRLTANDLAREFPKRRLFVFRLGADIRAGDLSPDSPRGRAFLTGVWSADVVEAARKATPYSAMRAAYDASDDHSFARGVCQGLWDASRGSLAAIRVTSVRTEHATTLGQSGFNLVLLGTDHQRMDVLVPDRQIDFVARPGGGFEEKTRWFGSAPATATTRPATTAPTRGFGGRR